MRGRRGGGERDRESRGGERLVNGRPRKTQEELDQEMEDYWGSQKKDEGANGAIQNGAVPNGNANGFGGAVFAAPAPVQEAVAVADDGDIDMIE